jgi:hypothetical protein
MGAATGDVDELIEFWTLLDEERELLAGKRGATALGFALLLKHFRAGCHPCQLRKSTAIREPLSLVAPVFGAAVAR